MSLRDIDLVLGALMVLAATLLSGLGDPAIAIIILSLSISTFIVWLGEDRIEALWRAYTAPPPLPAVARPRPEERIKMYRRPTGPVRAAPLAQARLIQRRGPRA